MDFDAALAALQQRGPGRMVPDLDRITRLAAMLGDPQLAYPSVHVTGTNGKTSATRMIATLLTLTFLPTLLVTVLKLGERWRRAAHGA